MPKRILIVDDHAIVRRMLKVLVETQPSWEVCGEAENGQEAISKVLECRPDVVIMDMAMPVKDGISATREISKAMPDVPIVMHTLHYSPELELEAKKAGARKVVPKAESGDALLEAIAQVLKEDLTRLPIPENAAGTPTEISANGTQEQNNKVPPSKNGSNRRNQN